MTEADVPILGQQVTVLGYAILPTVKCACDAPPLQLVGQHQNGQWQAASTACPQCQNIYRIQTVGVDARGNLRFAIEVSRPAGA